MDDDNTNLIKKDRELTVRAVIWGILIGLVLMALMIYLDGVVGMDMNAAPVASMLGIFLIPLIGGKTSRKELNIMQTCATAVTFAPYTLSSNFTVIVLMGHEFKILPAIALLLLANSIGICIASLFRSQYVDDETLTFPMAKICLTALEKVDDKKGRGAIMLFGAAAIGLVISFMQNTGILPMMAETGLGLANVPFGILIMPMIVGIGYVIGAKAGLLMLVTSLLLCFVESPFGASHGWFDDPAANFGAVQDFNLPLVIGMSLVGAIIPLIRQRNSIIKSFSVKGGRSDDDIQDYSSKTMLILLIVFNVILIAFCNVFYHIPIIAMIVCMLLNLLIVMIIIRINAETGMSAALALNMFVIIIAYLMTKSALFAMIIAFINFDTFALGQDTMIDFKVGRLIGASPKKQIKVQFIGLIVGTFAGAVLYYGILQVYGTDGDLFTFPFANMYYSVISGISEGGMSGVFNLGRFGLGAAAGAGLSLVGIPGTIIALALYLAPSTIIGVAIGGIIRFVVEKAKGFGFASECDNIATGFIIGDAIASIAMVASIMLAS